MKQTLSKVTALFLAVIMVVLLCPIGTLADAIVESTASSNDFQRMKKSEVLGGSFNMLDLITNPDDPKSIEYATFKYDFWDSNADWSVIAPSFPAVNAYGVFNNTLIRDVASYVTSQSKTSSVSVGVGVSAKIALFSASLNFDAKMSGTVTNDTSSLSSHTYFLQEYVLKKATYSMHAEADDTIEMNPEEYLTEAFFNKLKDINFSPAELFEEYGTHVIWQCDVGGRYTSRAEVKDVRYGEEATVSTENAYSAKAILSFRA